MPSRLSVLALVTILIGILLSPQIASTSISQSAIIQAPSEFVRSKALDYEFVLGLQNPLSPASLDALVLVRRGHKFSAILSDRFEYIDIENSGPPRPARVVANFRTRFEYREEFEWAQGVVVRLRFGDVKLEGGGGGEMGAEFVVEKIWKGSLVQLALGWLGIMKPPGGGVGFGGVEMFKKAVENAYEDKRGA